MGKIKQINIKNRTYHSYSDQIDLKNFDANLLKIDKKDFDEKLTKKITTILTFTTSVM